MLSNTSVFSVALFACSGAFSESALRDNIAARELIELVVDHVETAEPVARYKWSIGVSVDSEKGEAQVEDIAVFKTTALDAEAFGRAQAEAFRARQKQLFAVWKASGVDGFDDVEDPSITIRPQLRKNAEEEMKRLGELRPVLCHRTVVADMNEVAVPVLKRRSMDANLIQPVVKSLETIARDDGSGCETKSAVVTKSDIRIK